MTALFIEIKKIILVPQFEWISPDEWVNRLLNEGLHLQISSRSGNGAMAQQTYTLSSFNNPYLFQPVFTLSQPIHIPNDLWTGALYLKNYPLEVSVELKASVEKLGFDVLVVYDEG